MSFLHLKVMQQVFSLELRRVFAYRVDFWVNFFIGVFARFAMSYFLWKSLLDYSGVSAIGGYTLDDLILYNIAAYLIDQMVRSAIMKRGILAQEIYDGTLSRYLLYPVDVVRFKFAMVLSQLSLSGLQFILGMVTYRIVFGWPEAPALTAMSFLLGFISIIPALVGFYFIALTVELVAFWAENVWSLNVMLRFISAFLGGVFVPLELFPESVREILYYLPFYYFHGAPAKFMMGRLGISDLGQVLIVSGIWILFFVFLSRIIWKRGVKHFTGVGI